MTTATAEKQTIKEKVLEKRAASKAPAKKAPASKASGGAKKAPAKKAPAKKAAAAKAAAPKPKLKKCPSCGERHPVDSFEEITVTENDKRTICGFCADNFKAIVAGKA